MLNKKCVNEKLLRECLLSLDIHLADGAVAQLVKYIGEIELFNPALKLVKASGDDLIIRHIIDSLSPYHIFKKMIDENPTATFCDVGSGPGLPGIPLAIAFSNQSFTFIERMTRRVDFLETELAVLGLNDRVTVLPQDLKDVDNVYDIVTFRAFHPLFDILDDINTITDQRSSVCAYKAKEESISEEMKVVAEKCSSRWKWNVVELSVPHLDAERRMCILKKD